MRKWYDNLNERIYENCLMYYENYSQQETLKLDQISVIWGLYQGLNIVNNDLIINTLKGNPKYEKLLKDIEENPLFK